MIFQVERLWCLFCAEIARGWWGEGVQQECELWSSSASLTPTVICFLSHCQCLMPYSDSCCNAQYHFHLHTTCCQFQFKPNSKPLPYSSSFRSATVSCCTVTGAVTLNTISIYTPLAVSFNSNPNLSPCRTSVPFTVPLSHAVQWQLL